MRILNAICWILGTMLIGFMFGAWMAEPQNCMPVCIEAFEQMAC